LTRATCIMAWNRPSRTLSCSYPSRTFCKK
jgi:hypothetical protein